MMGGLLLRGILMGLLFGVPVGAVGVMTVERTWNYGIRAGILTFLFAFSWFGITADSGLSGGLMVVLGVFLGTYFWWGALSVGVGYAKKRGKWKDFRYMNRIFGVVLSLFGIGILWSV